MKIDHVVADIDRACDSVFNHVESQAAIERQHGIRVLHGERHVVESR